jgi:hypothetical protein
MGYRLYDLQSHSYFVSRDVICHEHIFPCDQNPGSIVFPPPPDSDISSFPVIDGVFTLPPHFPDTPEYDNNFIIILLPLKIGRFHHHLEHNWLHLSLFLLKSSQNHCKCKLLYPSCGTLSRNQIIF